jgi:hypothetical protein
VIFSQGGGARINSTTAGGALALESSADTAGGIRTEEKSRGRSSVALISTR